MSERVLTAEQIVQALSAEELSEFSEWFAEFQSELWDSKIEQDSLAGKLDEMISQANKDFSAGVAREI